MSSPSQELGLGIARQQSDPHRAQPTRSLCTKSAFIGTTELHMGTLCPKKKARIKARPETRLDGPLRTTRRSEKKHGKINPPRRRPRQLVVCPKIINQHGKVVSSLVHYDPNPRALVWGGVMCALQLGMRFPSYLERLLQLFEQAGSVLGPLSPYAESLFVTPRLLLAQLPSHRLILLATAVADSPPALTLVYGHMLNFNQVINSTFVDNSGCRKGGPWTFEQLIKMPFKERFSEIMDVVRGHCRLAEYEARAPDQQRSRIETRISSALASTIALIAEVENKPSRKKRARRLQKRDSVLAWLSPLDISTDHEDAYSLRHAKSGSWLLQDEKYQEWINGSSSSLLWCYGKPGCGKTVLASIVLEDLRSRSWPLIDGTAVAFTYCNFRQQEKCRSEPLVLSLLHQICRMETVLPFPVEVCYDRLGVEGMRAPTWSELSEMMLKTVSSLQQTVIVVDGLDECVDLEKISPLLEQLAKVSETCVKIFVTSRPRNTEIKNAFKDFDRLSIETSLTGVFEDIQGYVISKVDRLIETGKLCVKDEALKTDIWMTLANEADGMFLWAKLQLDALCGLGSEEEIRKALCALPRGLDRVYQTALQNIAHQDTILRKLARKVLMWVLYSGRRLHMTELLEALAVKADEQRIDPANRLSDPCLVTSVCAGLVEVRRGYVQLVHSSIQDFFLSEGEEVWGPLDFHIKKNPSNVEISQTLLTYLMHDDLDIGDAVSLVELSDGFRSHPLALYAAAFWADHIRGAAEKALHKLLLEMLENSRPNSSPMRILFGNSFLQNGRFEGFPKDSNPLHILVSNNLEYTVRQLPHAKLKKYLNGEDCDGETPCLIATRENMSSMAEFLIKAGAKIHHRSPRGLDSLHRACMHGNIKIVELLLSAGANPNVQTKEGTTIPSFGSSNGQQDEEVRLLSHAGWNALHASAFHGRTAVVRMLIEAKVDVNALSEAGWTAVYEAISNNHPRIVEQLIMAGADVDLRRENGESVYALAIRLGRFTCLRLLLTKVSDVKLPIEGDTMLNKAALSGNLSIVDCLIARGADVDAQTEDKASFPLYSAAWKGHYEVCERLVKAGANVNITKTNHYATALLAAVQNNQKKIVTLLLESGADPKLQLDNWSILHCASQSKSLEMVEIALSTKPDINGQGSVGRTPLQNACEEGCDVEILQKLFENGADPHVITGEHQRSCLYYAALNGHEHIVEWLLGKGVDVNAQNDTEDTALTLACVNGYLPIVRHLLKAGCDVNLQNSKKRPGLLDAASCGHSAIVELLVKGGADLEISDVYQFTALSLAAGNNRWAISHMLVEAGAAIDGRGPGGWSAAMSAARSGYRDVLQYLIEKGADVRLASDDGNTAMHLAAENGHVDIIVDLIERGALVNAHEKGRTPLFEAAKNGHVEAIKRLLVSGADPLIRIPEERCVTPIQCAASYNHPLSVKEFLNAGVPIDLADSEGCTALHYAARFGRAEVIQMLLDNGCDKSLKTKTPHGCATALDFACMNGHIESVRVLTAAGFDVNARNGDGVVPLHWASFFGHTTVVEHLLAKEGIEVDAQTRDKMTPLIDACLNGRGPVLALLLAAGADSRLADEYGRNGLHYACKKGHADLLKPLLATGLDINLRDSNNWTPLQTAVWHGHVRLIKDLVDAGADASLLYANDLSLLHLAIQADQLAMVDFLAKDKSTLEFKTSDCWTPLYSASWAGKLELVEHLLGAGANLESKNYADNIPLHIAAYKGHKEVVTYLLSLDDEQETHLVEEIAMDDTEDRPVCEEKSKDATATETGSASARNGETSFSEKPTTEGTGVEVIGTAMEVNNTTKDTSANGPGRTINPSKDKSPAVPKLVPKAQIIDGVEVPEKPSPLTKRMVATYNQDGEYPIHSAAIHGHTEVVKILLLHGADCNVQRDSGATPLHLASRGGHLETVQLLLDHKADPNIQNNSGRTPLHYASEKTNEAVAKALLNRGANPNLLDKHGRSPLHRACLIGAESMAKLLHAAGADPFLIDDAGRSVEDWSHINGVDLELESPPEQSAKKRRKRDATIKKLLDDADLSKIWGFDTVGRLLTYYGRDLDAQICFERAATFIFEDGPVDDPPSAKEEGKTSESESTAIATEEPSPTPNSENPKKETPQGKPMQGRPEACKSIIEKWEATATSETEPQTAKPDIATPAPSLPTDADLESELDKPENSDPAMSEPGPENATPDNPPPDPSLPPDSTAESQPDNPPTPPSVTPKISHRACCDGCPDRPRLLGIRFVCRSCDDRDLCEACMEKYPKADGGVDVPGCKGHAFLRLPQEGWEHFDYDVVTAEGLSAEEWLGGMREEWAWREILNAEGL